MSYQVLARKWRPRSFSEMVGQEHVLRAMINALDQQRLHHAYLFTGTRGVGKTTIARILAKSLNCEKGVTSQPCGTCSACREIDEGRFVDLIEVDAASRTKVEDTRELLENVQYTPTRGRYKVYLIDEVHMLSGHSFNALLKTLEEPPEHVKFLLATTDPQKLPITILSRCLQFSLKAMLPERIVQHLKKVLAAEQVDFEEPALWALARGAQGSMRDAMSLTDQAIAFGNGKITEQEVAAMLGTVDRDWVWRILEPLVSRDEGGRQDVASLFQALQALADHAPDYSELLGNISTALHRITVAQIYPDAVDDHEGDKQKVLALAAQMSAEDVQLYYQIALNGRRDLPLAPEARTGFEMAILRMMLFRPVEPAPPSAKSRPTERGGREPSAQEKRFTAEPQGAGRSPQASTRTAQGGFGNAPAGVRGVAQGASSSAAPALSKAFGATAQAHPGLAAAPSQTAVPAQTLASVQTLAPSEAAVAAQGAPPRENVVEFSSRTKKRVESGGVEGELSSAPNQGQQDLWSDTLARMEITGPVLNFARNCALESVQKSDDGAEVWQLSLSPKHEFLLQSQRLAALENKVREALQRAVVLNVLVQEPTHETPDVRAARYRKERQQRAEAMFTEDPFVKGMMREFGAVLERHSIAPLDDGDTEQGETPRHDKHPHDKPPH
ncbi:DNA polymerase III (subunits tau and gamma) [gamma proteobacterium HdN1]|nr:DNA polymerase III (subunits tau and gamma) [gamma proteobacterium HdN1]